MPSLQPLVAIEFDEGRRGKGDNDYDKDREDDDDDNAYDSR